MGKAFKVFFSVVGVLATIIVLFVGILLVTDPEPITEEYLDII